MRRTRIAKWTGFLGLTLAVVATAVGADMAIPQLLPEGTMLRSVDGVIVGSDSNDVWHFEVTRDVNEAGIGLPAGARLELLPSVTLGDMLVDANDRVAPHYRLTGQVTLYRQKNFLLAGYFLPLSKLRDANEPGGLESGARPTEATFQPTRPDDMTLPPEILERLRERRAARRPQQKAPAPTVRSTDPQRILNRVLVDAVGFVERRENRWEFVPDALGRNVSALRYELLPCRVLEQTQGRLAAAPERMRCRVAGLVTGRRGQRYLLLQRVTRVYNHGNFGG